MQRFFFEVGPAARKRKSLNLRAILILFLVFAYSLNVSAGDNDDDVTKLAVLLGRNNIEINPAPTKGFHYLTYSLTGFGNEAAYVSIEHIRALADSLKEGGAQALEDTLKEFQHDHWGSFSRPLAAYNLDRAIQKFPETLYAKKGGKTVKYHPQFFEVRRKRSDGLIELWTSALDNTHYEKRIPIGAYGSRFLNTIRITVDEAQLVITMMRENRPSEAYHYLNALRLKRLDRDLNQAKCEPEVRLKYAFREFDFPNPGTQRPIVIGREGGEILLVGRAYHSQFRDFEFYGDLQWADQFKISVTDALHICGIVERALTLPTSERLALIKSAQDFFLEVAEKRLRGNFERKITTPLGRIDFTLIEISRLYAWAEDGSGSGFSSLREARADWVEGDSVHISMPATEYKWDRVSDGKREFTISLTDADRVVELFRRGLIGQAGDLFAELARKAVGDPNLKIFVVEQYGRGMLEFWQGGGRVQRGSVESGTSSYGNSGTTLVLRAPGEMGSSVPRRGERERTLRAIYRATPHDLAPQLGEAAGLFKKVNLPGVGAQVALGPVRTLITPDDRGGVKETFTTDLPPCLNSLANIAHKSLTDVPEGIARLRNNGY